MRFLALALFASTASAGTVTGRIVENKVRVAEYGVVTPDGVVHEVKDGDGRFIVDLPAGNQTLRFVGWAFVNHEVPDIKVLAIGKTDIGTITVEPGGHASGRVVDGTGQPVAGANVFAFGQNPTEIKKPLEMMAAGTRSAITGEDGGFVIDGIDTNNVRIEARFRERRSLELPVTPDPVELELASTGGLTGSARRPGETMIAIAVDDDDAVYTTEITEAGEFKFDALPEGHYDLTLGGNVATIAPLRVGVVAGMTVVAPFAIPKQLVNLVVQSHADCVLAQLFGARQHEKALDAELVTQTCDDGVLRFTGLAPGKYRVCVDDDRCEDLTLKPSPRVQTVRVE